MTRAAIYVRLSRETEETTSPARQRTACERLVADRGYEYDPASDLFEDIDVSAYSGRRRPGFEDLLAQLDRYGVVVFWRLDRVARSTVGFGQILEAFGKSSTSLVSATEPFDTSTPIGEAMAWIVMVFAQLESRTIGVRVRSAQEHLVAVGRDRGGHRPFGWQRAPAVGRPGSLLVLDPVEAPLLVEAVDRVLVGVTVPEVVRGWNAAGVTTALGGPWTRQVLLKTLRSPRLIGQVVRHGRPAVDGVGDVLVTNEPLIDEWTWLRLQAELDRRRASGRRQSGQSLVGGIARCAECGGRMYGGTRSYACQRRADDGAACPGNAIRRTWLDDAVVAFVAERLADPAVTEAAQEQAAAKARGSEQQGRMDVLRAKLDRLEADRLAGLYDDPDGYRRFAAQHDAVAREIADSATSRTPTAASVDELTGGRPPTLEELQEMQADDPVRLRSIVAAIVDRIDVSKGSRHTGGRRDPTRIRIVPR